MTRQGEVRDEVSRLQQAMWVTQRVGWALMGAVVVAALTGALGGGGLGFATARTAGQELALRYPRIARLHREDPIEFRGTAGRDTLLAIELSHDFADGWIVERTDPPPLATVSTQEGDRLVFRVEPGSPVKVELGVRARRAGSVSFRARMGRTSWLPVRSLVLP